MQSLSTSSGAPLVYWTMPSAVLWTVLIILRMESKGASPTRGSAALRRGLAEAEAVRVVDEGALGRLADGDAVSSSSASEQRLMAVARSFSSSP